VKKPARYSDFGVPEYWVIDAGEAVAWVYDFRTGSAVARHAETVTWQPHPSVPPLEIRLSPLFLPL
jgi:Uma2 family endonuclease